jgi:NOL1/NOP2/fmu family ribosome biogenesis protein
MVHANPIVTLSQKHIHAMHDFLISQYGVSFASGTFLLHTKDNKIFLLSPKAEEFRQHLQRINSQGLYVGEFNDDFTQIRLSIEGSQIIGPNATRGIYELTKEELQLWSRGESLPMDVEPQKGYLIMKYGSDFYGVGRFKQDQILNFVPKVRRLKTLNLK